MIASLLLFWMTVGGMLIVTISRNQGHLVYVLDDAYIHMAIAKTLRPTAFGG